MGLYDALSRRRRQLLARRRLLLRLVRQRAVLTSSSFPDSDLLRLLGSGDSLGLGSRGVCGNRRLVALVVSPA